MFPAFTQVDRPDTQSLVTVQEARDWLGLYGDDSVNDVVTGLVDAAIEKISNWLGRVITQATVYDYYPRGCREFTPSQPGIKTVSTSDPSPNVELAYYAADGTLTVVDGDNYTHDPTTQNYQFVLNSDYRPDVHEKYENPWRLKYTNDIAQIRDVPAKESIKLAIKIGVTRYWQHRGRIDPNPHATDKAFQSVLGPAKRMDWYMKLQEGDVG